VDSEPDRELEVIRSQMDRTRSSLAEKIGALESQVSDTVGGVTTAVETVKDTVTGVTEAVSSATEKVSDTVNSLTSSVSGTVQNLTDSVSGTVETVKQSLDPTPTIRAHPWSSVACSVACGFLGGYLLGGPRRSDVWPSEGFFGPSRAEAAPPPPSSPAYAPAAASNGHSDGQSMAGVMEPVKDTLSDIGGAVKSLGISALMGVVGHLAKSAVPEAIQNDVCGAIDRLKTKLGGHHTVNPGELFNTNSNNQ
jgi:ElaB/YqjD/DUF883 family membrane-anchored ribosome-binding protein